jgi:exopolyphosphatase/guanosine-5'-triphosphate,3'-diphosphate pyrophosphatase
MEAALQSTGFALHLLCLRLAVIVCHARDDVDRSAIALRTDGGAPAATLAPSWAESHPRALHLLRDEIDAWARTGVLAPRLAAA